MQRIEKQRFNYEAALRQHVNDYENWDLEEEERLESQSPWEAAFEYGEELALEEQATMGADDEDWD